ncbi:MAG TPA: spermidine/putrescine ABC transporter substrate-binding protein [Firmicutes bacterium]|nr:spermidine/putrescine ABC transporter substrate-binding protein [Bacillota bacterium]
MKGVKSLGRIGKAAALFVALVLLTAGLSGCTRDKPTIYVYNWGDYIDESILEEFEKETKIKVVYDTYATNEDMYVKIKAGGSAYDVIFPSDYMLTRMIEEDLVQKLDLSKIPNWKYIEKRHLGWDYDPANEYSLPYYWGTVGILYNTIMVGDPVDSWDILWNPKYEKEILMLDSQRDSIAVALLRLGYSINTLDENELAEAGELLKEQKPLVLAYVVDESQDKMIAGEAAMAVVWSGEVTVAKSQNPDLAFAIPQEGTNLWFDVMAVPKNAKNPEGAMAFINFMLDPEIAYRNADYTGYAVTHESVRSMIRPEISEDRSVYPEEEDLVNAEVFVNLGQTLSIYDRIWTEVKAH